MGLVWFQDLVLGVQGPAKSNLRRLCEGSQEVGAHPSNIRQFNLTGQQCKNKGADLRSELGKFIWSTTNARA